MITIVLSERDFDYEIQALVNSFFPGTRSQILIGEEPDDYEMLIKVCMAKTEIRVSLRCRSLKLERAIEVSGDGDPHKREKKRTHPYRAYYKNELKKVLFMLLRDYPEESLPSDVIREIPVWGTMTGVRPTKIAMNELLSVSAEAEVRQKLQETYLCSPEKARLAVQIAVKEKKLLESIDYEGAYSLYIGIPFCPSTCLYCSFPSYSLERFGHLMDGYLQALKQEISKMAEAMQGRRLSCIYIGGGTPTALSAEQLDDLLSHVRRHFPQPDSCEFTVEAGRPDSISREKLQVLREYGVGRISVNPQTMQQKTLELIGRKHTVRQIEESFYLARDLGFPNINMDLIVGLPGEDVSDFRDTLRQIHVLNPDSITFHSLVIKRASALRSVLEEQQVPMEEPERQRGRNMDRMLELASDFAEQYSYEPYYMYRQKNSAGHAGSSGQENIGYARAGRECLYNILIMEEKQTIVAVGAGASTKLYHPELKQVSRIENVKSVMDYISRIDEMIERKYLLL